MIQEVASKAGKTIQKTIKGFDKKTDISISCLLIAFIILLLARKVTVRTTVAYVLLLLVAIVFPAFGQTISVAILLLVLWQNFDVLENIWTYLKDLGKTTINSQSQNITKETVQESVKKSSQNSLSNKEYQDLQKELEEAFKSGKVYYNLETGKWEIMP